MRLEDAIARIRRDVPCTEYLRKARHGGYICPVCGSGTGPKGTGALKYYPDTNTCACHACEPAPGQKGKKARFFDVLEIIQQEKHCSFIDAVKIGADRLNFELEDRTDAGWKEHTAARQYPSLLDVHNLELDELQPTEPAGAAAQATESHGTAAGDKNPGQDPKTAQSGPQSAQDADYIEYFRICRDRLNDPRAVSYLAARGISKETARACNVGFDPAADPASAPAAIGDEHKPHPCPRIILPTSPRHYVARSIDANTPPEYMKLNPSKEKGAGSPFLFNWPVLVKEPAAPVFVTEGAFDALSFAEIGQRAIATNSKNNGAILLEGMKYRRYTASCFVIVPDNDPGEKGESTLKTAQELQASLQAAGYPAIVYNVAGDYKDANDALTADKEGFTQRVKEAVRAAAQEIEKGSKPDNIGYYIRHMMGSDLEKFKKDIKTGYNNLDSESGGLYAGLYVIAAISSLGKTTFTHQMADQIAESGTDVLFFSLEQSRLELVSKSIARRLAQKDINSGVTSLRIRKGSLPAPVLDAAREYADAIGDRLSIVECNFSCNISFISDYIRGYLKRNPEEKPVVIIDYLQIVQPQDTRKSAKEATDATVTELKRLSRDLDLTIILISSVNRANYQNPIDFESLKESGGIEYTADVVWGLQLQCLSSDPIFTKESNVKEKRETVRRAKNATPRKIELVCLKNRYGRASYACGFEYYPAVDLFREEAQITLEDLKTGAVRI